MSLLRWMLLEMMLNNGIYEWENYKGKTKRGWPHCLRRGMASLFYYVTFLLCYLFIMLPFYYVTFLLCYLFTIICYSVSGIYTMSHICFYVIISIISVSDYLSACQMSNFIQFAHNYETRRQTIHLGTV